MRGITTPSSSYMRRSLAEMEAIRGRAEGLQQQISTGDRLQRSSDDPLAASQLRAMARAERLSEVDRDTLAITSQQMQLADNAMQDMADIFIRARELAMQGASDTLGDDQRFLISEEVDQLHNALLAAANARGIDGGALFGGDAGGVAGGVAGGASGGIAGAGATSRDAYVVDALGAVQYQGASSSGEVQLQSGLSIERGVTGPEVLQFGNSDGFALLADLSAVLQSGTAGSGAVGGAGAAVRDMMGQFDDALDTVTKAQTLGGARLSWIETLDQRLIRHDEVRAARTAEVGGTNITEAIVEMQQALTVLEASQASFTRLSNLSLFDALR